MQQQLQEFDFNVVHRAGAKHGNADGLSRMLEEGPNWMPGEKEKAFGSCPEPMSLELASQKAKQHQVETVTMISETQEEDEEETITWERTPSEISTLQREDDAMSQVFYWAELGGDAGDMPSLGTNLIPKEQAIQYGPEALAYWSRWNELSIRGGVLYKKWFPRDDLRPVLQKIVPATGRKEILNQLHSSQISGGHFAVEKTLARIRQRFWWPTMRTDVKKKIQWCLTCAARSTGGKKRVAGLVPFSGDPIQHIGGGHPRARDVGSKVSCEAHLSDDGLVHEVCNCRPTCIHGFGRGGPGDSRELGTQVWGTEHPAHRSREELWE